jgi:DNA-binding transcriptional MerR regulator
MTTKSECFCCDLSSEKDNIISEQEIVTHYGIDPETLSQLRRHSLIEPINDTTSSLYTLDVVRRVKCILRLQQDLGVDFSALGIILDLLERIESLEERLHYYEARFQAEKDIINGLEQQ